MATDPSPELIARPGGRAEGAAPGAAGGVLQKFQALPRPMQIAILVGSLLLVFYLMSALRGGSGAKQSPRQTINLGDMRKGVSATFSGIETDRPAVMQSVFEQNRRDMSELRTKIESDFATRDQALQSALGQNQELQRQMQQMMGDFTTELKNIQVERARDNERLAQLADQQRQLELNAPVDGVGVSNPVGAGRKRAISQVNLGGGGGGIVGAVTRPFGQGAGATGATHLDNSGLPIPSPAEDAESKRLPFIPPLGFVKATLLNGVDALVGGSATPALARFSGTYKTAMGSTVSLDGCFGLLEFEGNISTERATGKPVRMTCVYPDGGAATYSLSGYAVDADDGIIGIPGILYEGDPTRITAALMADFAAGMGAIVEDNSSNNTTTISADGNVVNTSFPTGNQTKAQIFGGVNKVMSSLRDYLQARVDRTQAFIRLDATREVHLVILNGTELRKGGDVWTSLFDGNKDSGIPTSNLPVTYQPQSSAAAPTTNAAPAGASK